MIHLHLEHEPKHDLDTHWSLMLTNQRTVCRLTGQVNWPVDMILNLCLKAPFPVSKVKVQLARSENGQKLTTLRTFVRR